MTRPAGSVVVMKPMKMVMIMFVDDISGAFPEVAGGVGLSFCWILCWSNIKEVDNIGHI